MRWTSQTTCTATLLSCDIYHEMISDWKQYMYSVTEEILKLKLLKYCSKSRRNIKTHMKHLHSLFLFLFINFCLFSLPLLCTVLTRFLLIHNTGVQFIIRNIWHYKQQYFKTFLFSYKPLNLDITCYTYQ